MKKEAHGIGISYNKNIFIAIILVVIFIILLVIFIKRETTNQETECQSNNDCILQQTTCCSCNMGGTSACMSRENASFYQKELQKCQEDIICIAMYNCEFETCECKESKCVGK